MGPNRDLEIQRRLPADYDLAGLFEQNAQLSVGMRRTKVRQDHHPARILTGDLHRHRTRSSAHFPHVRHRPNLPA
ncbi:hypothetical protein MPOR_19620 [Mycolicibacterium poriferae]|uniref:Uncharacterized protein n=1 Tax=Mycolicibacterium poriferae TaxID=39694 RepID=A0A6N4V5W2_9MYCO|nr:hypothetical protein MPOR_19620 [Mycolicibacterium poriferae]